jgi:predicted transcriptional regulator
MSEHVLSIRVGQSTADTLAVVAKARNLSIEEVAIEALDVFALVQDNQGPAPYTWSQEDLDAIQLGIDQLDRGEFYTQEEVEAHIDAVLRE